MARIASLTAPSTTRTTRFRASAPLSRRTVAAARRARRATSGRNLRTAAKNDEGEDNPLFEAFKKYKEANPDEFGGGSTTKVATEKKKKEDEGNKTLDLRSIKNLVKPKPASKPKADGGLKFNAPGLAKNVEVFTEWRATYKALKDFGLESIGAKDAAARVDAKTAVIVDVRTGKFYEKEHIEGSLSLPSYTKAKGVKGNLGKKLFLGSKTTEKNPDFASEAKSLLGDETRTIVLACTTGGTLKTEVERRDGKRDAYVDSQRAFGRDSLSLRAAKDLVDAGITNIAHLDGGIAAWKAEGLPVEGSDVGKERIEGLPWLGTAATYYGNKSGEDGPVKEKKPSVLGFNMGTQAYAVWPVVHEKLSEMGLRSVPPGEAKRMADEGEAVIVDISKAKDYMLKHIDPSISVPFYQNMKGNKSLGNIRNFLSGSIDQPQERNPNFVEDAKATIKAAGGEGKTIVVTCNRGGTLRTEAVDSSSGKVFKDPQLKYGVESSSLRAAYELISAGVPGVVHMEGGNSGWSYEKLPVAGKSTVKVKRGAYFPKATRAPPPPAKMEKKKKAPPKLPKADEAKAETKTKVAPPPKKKAEEEDKKEEAKPKVEAKKEEEKPAAESGEKKGAGDAAAV